MLFLLAVELGRWLGAYRRRQTDEENGSYVLAMVSATMGLLAFVLAFTFGLAATRFDNVKQSVVADASDIRTTYLRAGMLPHDRTKKVRGLLREYVELRLTAAASAENLERALRRSEELHKELWQEAEAAGRANPDSIPVELFIESLNTSIEMHATRLKLAVRGSIPMVLWGALYLVSILTLMAVGYHSGLIKTRRSPVVVAMIMNLAIVLLLIADLDRPQGGMLRVSQQAMVDLQQTMSN